MPQATWDNNWGKGWDPDVKPSKQPTRGLTMMEQYYGVNQQSQASKNKAQGLSYGDGKTLTRPGASPAQGIWGLMNQGPTCFNMQNFNALGQLPSGAPRPGGFEKQKQYIDFIESRGGGRNALGTMPGASKKRAQVPSGYTEQMGTGVYTHNDDQTARNQAAIRQNQQNTQDSYAEDMIDFQYDLGSIGGDAPWKNKRILAEEKATENLGGNWYDNIGKDVWSGIKGMGAKQWLDLGIRGMEVYGGFQERKAAEKQHALASDVFAFQKQAYNTDLAGRTTAYNTRIEDVNAWKAAQGRSDMSKLMPTTLQV